MWVHPKNLPVWGLGLSVSTLFACDMTQVDVSLCRTDRQTDGQNL